MCRCQASRFPEFLLGVPQCAHVCFGSVWCKFYISSCEHLHFASLCIHYHYFISSTFLLSNLFIALCFIYWHNLWRYCFVFFLPSDVHQDSFSSSSSSLVDYWDDVSLPSCCRGMSLCIKNITSAGSLVGLLAEKWKTVFFSNKSCSQGVKMTHQKHNIGRNSACHSEALQFLSPTFKHTGPKWCIYKVKLCVLTIYAAIHPSLLW